MSVIMSRWVHGDSNRTWSNYTGCAINIVTVSVQYNISDIDPMLISCVDKEDMSYHTSLNNLHLIGLLVSTALLMVSLVIFTIFPR